MTLKQTTIFLSLVVFLLIGCIAIETIMLATAAKEYETAQATIASQRSLIDEISDQRDRAYKKMAEMATEDTPITTEEATKQTDIDGNEATFQNGFEIDVKVFAEENGAKPKENSEIGSCGDDVDLLARLIFHEIGSDGHPDEQLYIVGSVVLNRIADSRFPNNVHDVIYEPGQYAPAINGTLYTGTPTERCYDIAADLLANGSVIPGDVVWQSGVPQGVETWATYASPVTGATMHYCR